jgi:hypothetical protein
MRLSIASLVLLVGLSLTEAWQPSHRPVDRNCPPTTTSHPTVAFFQHSMATCAAGAALGAGLLLSPLPAAAADATSFNVEINAPYLVDLVKSKEARAGTLDRVQFLVESVKNFLGPAVSVDLPTDIAGVAKKAFTGGATVQVNGQAVGVQVVGSETGTLTIQLASPLLPKLPIPGLPDTPKLVTTAANVAAEAAPAAVQVATKVVAKLSEAKPDLPFWDRPINANSLRIDVDALGWHRALTPADLVGGGSAGLGAAYASSFAFYKYELNREAETAAAKKEAMAAKRKAAVATKTAKPVKDAAPAVELELPATIMESAPVGEETAAEPEPTTATMEEDSDTRGRIKKILGMK